MVFFGRQGIDHFLASLSKAGEQKRGYSPSAALPVSAGSKLCDYQGQGSHGMVSKCRHGDAQSSSAGRPEL